MLLTRLLEAELTAGLALILGDVVGNRTLRYWQLIVTASQPIEKLKVRERTPFKLTFRHSTGLSSPTISRHIVLKTGRRLTARLTALKRD